MSVHPLADLTVLDRYKAVGNAFPGGFPTNIRSFYSPIDDVHGALKAVLQGAVKSLVISMYGFDDEELAKIIKQKLQRENCHVQLTLDSSQAGGVHEKTLLAETNYPASSIAIGRSEHGAIMHQKAIVVDNVILVTGSCNWSTGAETKQDNDLHIIADPYVAAEARARIDAIHANMIRKAAQ